ncbi:hypothetical protein [Paenimyroides aestuarii]|uniref:Gliding motility-associated protein GldM N-terminal domain-containing protein n=1 Tax=Paenimyroides aestuarii TaxID=2968490 RepID=A0ABY5NSC8_9FLAO|nr:hypothetical protein [Paenimyroides aestuarii]UUV21377.1 hypothetical protein NPX36_13765 [Paenimyroides aestuarii]
MKKIFLIIPILFLSCNSNLNTEDQIIELSKLQLTENNQLIKSLNENLDDKIKNSIDLIHHNQIKKCDSLSKEYFNYLQTVENEVNQKGFEVFFDGDKYSKYGKEYISQSEKYIKGIESITQSKSILERINIIFSTKYVTNEDGFNINYLDYYFKGFPKSQSTAFINDKRKEILTFENELIDELIIKSK